MKNYQISKIIDTKKYLEREVDKCNEKIFNFETKINTINNLFGTIEQVPLSQINHQLDIINELNLIKKDLNKKIKELNYINLIYDKLHKPRLAPIISEIIQPAIVPAIVPSIVPANMPMIVEQTTVEQINVEPVVQQIEEQQADNQTNEIYNALNYLQDQINSIISRVTNLELKN
jgi:hypothetical protein